VYAQASQAGAAGEKPMRILMVTPMPPQTQATNAVALVTRGLLMGLRPRHEVTLVTVAGPEPAEHAAVQALRAAGLEVHAACRSEPLGPARWKRRWRLARGLLGGTLPFRTVWYWEPEMQVLLNRLLAQQRFDVLQLEDNATGVYAYPTDRPIVLTEHEVRRPRPVDWGGWRSRNWAQWAWNENDWQRWRRYQPAVWRRCQRLQVFTARDAAGLQALAPDMAERVRVNPFGIEMPPDGDPAQYPEDPNTLIFAGGFSHYPNVDAALWLAQDILPRLRARCPGVRLVLVGSDPPPEVCALAAPNVEVTGRVPAIEPYVRRAALVLAPVRVGGGMRMKVLQGMALGKVVLTTPLGAEGLWQNGEAPPLALAETAEEFAAHAATLLADAPTRHALGCRARAFVAKHHSAQVYAQRAERIYAEVCNGG
jgi:polysaccharide biosynthesis protein PslH